MKIVLIGTQSSRLERAAVYTLIALGGYLVGRLVSLPFDLLVTFGYAVSAASAFILVWTHMSAMRIKLVRVDLTGISQVLALGDEEE